MTGARWLIPCALALVVVTDVRAQDTSDLEGLLAEPVLTTASKTLELASTAPGTSSTITAEELRTYGITSLDEALDFLALGILTEHPLSTVEIGARGVLLNRDYGNHVLLLINGHAANEAWDGTAYFDRGAGIPWELVDHIEVILGPGSVLYGSNAMLAVINVVTKRAKDFSGVHGSLESEVPHSIRGAAGWGREFTLMGLRGEMTVAADLYHSRGPLFSYGPQDYGLDSVTEEPKRFRFDEEPTGVWGGRARLTPYHQLPSAFASFTLGNLQLDVRGEWFRRATTTSWGTYDDPDNYERDRWLTADLRYHVNLSPIMKLSVRAYGDLYDYLEHAPSAAAEDCLDGQSEGCTYVLTGTAHWAGLDISSGFDWLKDGRVLTVMGFDGRLRSVGSREAYEPVQEDVPLVESSYRHTENALGAYFEQVIRPAWWLGLNGGIRLDHDQRFGSHISPRMALTVSPWRHGSFKAIYSEAFRAPTAFERYYQDQMGFLASPDLKPEVVRSVEMAVEQRFGAQRLRMALFRSWWKDIVALMDATEDEIADAQAAGNLDANVTSAAKYRNVAELDNYGVNAGVEGSFMGSQLRYGVNTTVARARQDNKDGSEPMPLTGAAQIFGNARISYAPGGTLPTLAAALRYVGRRPTNGSSFDPVPDAPPITEMRIILSGPMPFTRILSYRLMANYSFTTRSPYSVGPLELPTEQYTEQELSPLPRYKFLAGIYLNQP